MSTVVDAAANESDEEDGARDPFGDGAIEIDEETLRRASPAAWTGRVVSRIEDAVHRYIYGR